MATRLNEMVHERPIAVWLYELAGAAVAVQRSFDRAHLAEMAMAVTEPSEGPARKLREDLLPSRLALTTLEVDARFAVREGRESGFEVGLSLFGKPVHSFFELRHRQTKYATTRVTFEVEATPLHPDAWIASRKRTKPD